MPTLLSTAILAQWHPIATEPHAVSLSTLLGLTICVLLVVAARWGRHQP